LERVENVIYFSIFVKNLNMENEKRVFDALGQLTFYQKPSEGVLHLNFEFQK
jgi:hypothetical protein